MDGVPTLRRYLKSRTVTTCCEGYSGVKYHVADDGWETPIGRYCRECGEDCETKELVWMTHKKVAQGIYRELPEPVLVTDFLFDNLL
jgi:hypothetical protein